MSKSGLAARIIVLDECPSCGSPARTRLTTPGHWIDDRVFKAGEFGLERCGGCGLVFTNPRPSDDLLGVFYSADGYSPHEEDGLNSVTINYLLSRIESRQPSLKSPGARFLDFGCGGGALLREATRRFASVSGYDVSPMAIRSCRGRGLDVTDDLAALPSPVDAILMSHSLEHVSHFEQPLTAFSRILKPGTGRLFIAVPNARSLRAQLSPPVLTRLAGVNERYHAFPIHLSHFSGRSLQSLLSRYGFECVAMETYGFGIDAYFRTSVASAQRAAGGAPTNGNGAGGVLARTVKHRIKSAFMGAGLGENLLGIFARR